MLAITRDEVEAYCRERGLNYRVDVTNTTGEFTRNRVRRDVLPALRALNPRVVEAIARASEQLAADQAALDTLARTFLEAARVDSAAESGTDLARAPAVYRVAGLCEPPTGLRPRMLLEAIRQARAGRCAGGEITARHVAAVQQLLETRASGKRLQLPGGLVVWREFETLRFGPVDESAPAALDQAVELSAAQSQVETGGLVLMIERGLAAGRFNELVEQARQLNETRGRDWLMAILDDEALPASLLIRTRRRGERVRVPGRRQTIKLKKLMIDHTIPASRRAAWPVVTTPDDRYVWSPGLPPAVDFAARDETRTLAIVRALNL